jgi:chromosome segregation ATPase
VPGIGESKQRDINIWIQKYERRIPQLLEQDYVGKTAIKNRYTTKISQLEDNISELRGRQEILNKKIAKADKEINRLKEVTIADFILAVQSPENTKPAIEHYFQGAFAEWEPMPKWFKDIMREAEQ